VCLYCVCVCVCVCVHARARMRVCVHAIELPASMNVPGCVLSDAKRALYWSELSVRVIEYTRHACTSLNLSLLLAQAQAFTNTGTHTSQTCNIAWFSGKSAAWKFWRSS